MLHRRPMKVRHRDHPYNGGSVRLPKVLSMLLNASPGLNKLPPPGSPPGSRPRAPSPRQPGRVGLRAARPGQASGAPNSDRGLQPFRRPWGAERAPPALPGPRAPGPGARPRPASRGRASPQRGGSGLRSRRPPGRPQAPPPATRGSTGLGAAGGAAGAARRPGAGGAAAPSPGRGAGTALTASRCPRGPRSGSSWPPPARSQRSP